MEDSITLEIAMTTDYSYKVYTKFEMDEVTKVILGNTEVTTFDEQTKDSLTFHVTGFGEVQDIDVYVGDLLAAGISLILPVDASDVNTFTVNIKNKINIPQNLQLSLSIDELFNPHYLQNSGLNGHFDEALKSNEIPDSNKKQFEVSYENSNVEDITPIADTIISAPYHNTHLIKVASSKSMLSSKDVFSPSANFVCSPKEALSLLSLPPRALGNRTFLSADEVHGLYLICVLDGIVIFIGSERWPTVEAWHVDCNWNWSRPIVLRHFNSLFYNGKDTDEYVGLQKAPQFSVNPSGSLQSRTINFSNIPVDLRLHDLTLSGSSEFGWIAYGVKGGELKGDAYNLLEVNDSAESLSLHKLSDTDIENLSTPTNGYYSFFSSDFDTIRSIIDSNRAAFRFKDYFGGGEYSVYENKIIHIDNKLNPKKLSIISTLNTKFTNFDRNVNKRLVTQVNLVDGLNLDKFKIEFDNDIIEVYQNGKVYTYTPDRSAPNVVTANYYTARYRGTKVNITEDGEFYA